MPTSVTPANADPIPPNHGTSMAALATGFGSGLTDQLIASANSVPMANTASGPGSSTRPGGKSTAFEWTCSSWEQSGLSQIYMLINPATIRWSLPFRMTRANTFGGTTFQRWRSPGGSNADLPLLQFTFNTGLIYDTKSLLGMDRAGHSFYSQSSQEKLEAFYSFCKLSRIPAFTENGQPNLISIKYRTLVFPECTMFVHFTDPIQFSEDAMKPYNVEYSCSVVVLQMVPDIDSMDAKPFLSLSHIGNK